jgi:hypothetical protein
MEPLNFEDLTEGLNFVFVGTRDHFKNTMAQFKDVHNAYFVSKIDYRHITDKFIDINALVIIHKDHEVKILEVINFPNIDLDWVKCLKIFTKNYQDPNPSDKQFKWGQIATYDTEIMCNNCGYIETLRAGETYPICITCQSGLPDSPTEPDQSFWANLN